MKQLKVCNSWWLLAVLAAVNSGVSSTEGAIPPDNVRPAWIHGWPGDYARLTWDAAPEAISYNIYRFNDATATWEVIALSVTNMLAFDYSAGSAEKSYYVTAVAPDGESGPSAVVVTHDDPLVPYFSHSPPDVNSGTLTPTTATFQWTVSLTSGADGMLELSTDAVDFTVVYFNSSYQGAFSVMVSNLVPATQYTYRLTGVGTNRAGTAVALTFWTPNVNQPPTAADVTLPPIVDPWPVVVALTGTDPDGTGFPLEFAIVTTPTNGTLSPIYYYDYWGPRYVDYTPNPGARGADSFQYIANDGELNSAPAIVSIPSLWLNRPPQPPSFSTNTLEDTALPLDLTASDPDGDALTYQVFSLNGTVTGTPPNVVYIPNPDFNGLDLLLLYVDDGYTGGFAQGLVQITVAPVNDAPVATGQNLTAQEDVALPLTVIVSDVEGDTLTYDIVVAPAHGNLSGSGPDYVYTPAANYNGFDQFVFFVTDAAGVMAMATNNLTIQPVADPPVANPQSVTTPYNTPVNILLTGSDPDGDLQDFLVTGLPENGTLSGTPPTLTFTPVAGFSDTSALQFIARDSTTTSAPANVTITVQAATSTPAAPSGLTATAVSSSQINLSWTDNAGYNEDGFKVERSSNGNSWTQIATTGLNVTTYASTGLSANRTYYYRVRAYNVVGNSADSATASAKTLK